KSAALVIVGPPTADDSRSGPPDSGARYESESMSKNNMSISTERRLERLSIRLARTRSPLSYAADLREELAPVCQLFDSTGMRHYAVIKTGGDPG
ncbi:hypothetical protein EVAR_101680_1, partial [Eumeta japonica]